MSWLYKFSVVLIICFLLDYSYSNEDYKKCISPVKNANYHPVCGTDGVTYNNKAQLTCSANYKPGLRIIHTGKCNVRSTTQRPKKNKKTMSDSKFGRLVSKLVAEMAKRLFS